MRAKLVRTVATAALVGGLLAGCIERDHPNYARYEYLYVDGAFQPPYTEFPTGAERGGWRCYDAKINREFACTFVHGGWELYQYIYRPRRRAG